MAKTGGGGGLGLGSMMGYGASSGYDRQYVCVCVCASYLSHLDPMAMHRIGFESLRAYCNASHRICVT